MKYDIESYNNSDKQIDCICDGCGVAYKKERGELSKSIRKGTKRLYCKNACSGRTKKIAVKCSNCDVIVNRSESDFKKSATGRFFCTRRCAAIYNNHNMPKRKRKIKLCDCGNEIDIRVKTCSTCRSEYQLQLNNRTIYDLLYKDGANKYGNIRWFARRDYYRSAKKTCVICGYSNHIEVAHIKAISKFDEQTAISVVNSLNNLVGLCRNCHWELDNESLSITIKS